MPYFHQHFVEAAIVDDWEPYAFDTAISKGSSCPFGIDCPSSEVDYLVTLVDTDLAEPSTVAATQMEPNCRFSFARSPQRGCPFREECPIACRSSG